MQLTFEQAMNLVELLIIVIALILMHRSVPAAQLQGLFNALEKAAAQTPTTVDDTAVSVGKLFASLITGQMPGQSPVAGSTPAAVTQPSVTTAPPVPVPGTDTAPTQLGSAAG